MSAIAVPDRTDFLAGFSNTGSSQASQDIQHKMVEAMSNLRRAVIWSHADDAVTSLEEVFGECSVDGWDGYDSLRIDQATYNEAYKFINALPSWLPLPEIVPEPDGDIGFEWCYGKNKMFAVSVEGKGQLNYAGILGLGNKAHGTEIFDGSIPESIIGYISRITE